MMFHYLVKLSVCIVLIFNWNVCFAQAEFIGSDKCVDCHQKEYNAWQGSHHEMAMKHATLESVKGDFDNVVFNSNNVENHFFKKGNEYWVYIAGPDGKLKNYQIKYTFGISPLQQYMVEFPDGRVQLIPFAWDTRNKDKGGQRWFNLYPNQTKKHQVFFWTNTGQNWNYMCADCHSTNVKKNFNVENNTYNTTFSEINVGCEACHGPASEHLAWTKIKNNSQNTPTYGIGFNRNLSKAVSNWLISPNSKTLKPEKINHSEQTLVCAQCHSRHVQISEQDHVKSKSFGDRYLMSFINARLYYPDGQIYDEDYVYGSFLQSKMSQSGVVCSDCHDPHNAKLKVEQEQVCLQCHNSQAYDSPSHHNHKINSTGSQCVNCHMPETTYMKIDKRRDHRWHIPRPDLSKKLGTPDTCLSCHEDKTSNWSSAKVSSWGIKPPKDEQPFAPIFAAADLGYSQAANALSHISQNKQNAPIIRASALQRMSPFPNPNTLIAIARGVKSQDENIRLGAIDGAQSVKGAERWRILKPLLTDKVLAVRTEAARALLPLWPKLNTKQKLHLKPVIADYMTIQDFNSDRGFAHTNKANVYMLKNELIKAEKSYKTSIRIEPHFIDAYVNLAELYRRKKIPKKSIATLKMGDKANPANGIITYQLGLAYIREKRIDAALSYFDKATQYSPKNARYQYVYGLSLEDKFPLKAQIAIESAYKISKEPQYLYALCEMKIKQKINSSQMCIKQLSQFYSKEVIHKLQNGFKS